MTDRNSPFVISTFDTTDARAAKMADAREKVGRRHPDDPTTWRVDFAGWTVFVQADGVEELDITEYAANFIADYHGAFDDVDAIPHRVTRPVE